MDGWIPRVLTERLLTHFHASDFRANVGTLTLNVSAPQHGPLSHPTVKVCLSKNEDRPLLAGKRLEEAREAQGDGSEIVLSVPGMDLC